MERLVEQFPVSPGNIVEHNPGNRLRKRSRMQSPGAPVH